MRQCWRDHSVILIAIAACAVIMVGFASLMLYAGVATDRITQARETRLLQRAVDRKLATILEDVTSATIWNDAYDKSLRPTDVEWLDVNFGQYYHQYLKHDLTIVFDGQDRPFYASMNGEKTTPERLAWFAKAARPVLRELRAREAAKIRAHPDSLGFDRAVSAGAAVRTGGEVYLAQASTVVPEPGYRGGLVKRHPVVISAVWLGPKYLTTLDADYGLKHARLERPALAHGAWVALRDVEGAPVGVITWRPDRPGIGVYGQARWTILAAAALIVLLVALLVRRMDRLMLDLRLARVAADDASRAKSEFLANISHEIRTPLNGVLGMAHAMAADDLSPTQRERLTVVQDSGATLLALLNDVLDLSKIQAGKLEVEAAPFDLDTLCRHVCGTFQGVAAAKDVKLGFSVETDGRSSWRGDALRIRQVLSNLISNAVKFTERGAVTLTVRLAEGGLAFSVVDTGIGLDEEQISRLFQKFSQADASTTRRYGGSGLGLAICHELVGLMGGEFRVASTPGLGSEFSFVLPLEAGPALAEAAPAGAEAPPAADADRPLRILAAEDNPTNQLVLRAVLQPLELELLIVSNGLEAVRAFEDGAFDLVLMDVQMPEMSGVEATRAIRRQEAALGRPRTPIVALSANVMTHHVEEYRAAGMDDHLSKPVEVEKLHKLLERAAAGTFWTDRETPESAGAAG